MSEEPHTRKLATIVALDVAGYSARTEADEARTTAEVAALRKVIEGIAGKHGGRVFNTAGDGFMLEFGSSLAAVEAAFELAETCEPKVRVGVHLGDVVVQPNGDLLGHGVNVAARLMAKAEPGSVIVSADVERTVHAPMMQCLRSKGTVKLDKMAEMIEIFEYVPQARARRNLQARLTNFWKKRRRYPSWQTGSVVAGVIIIAGLAEWYKFSPSTPQTINTATEASIAVLPFENLSSEKDSAFFAAGIQDEILTRLTKIGSLKVISRTSTAHLASRPENLPAIARQLGVATILQGSVQREGDNVRVNVQLIKAATDGHLWAEVYDRKLENIFAVQSEIATAIAEALSANVTGSEAQALAAVPTKNTAAYDGYLRALAFYKVGDVRTAERFLQQAVKLDAGFAGAWALLVRVHALSFNGGDRSPARREAARQAMEQALRVQPGLAEAQLAQAYYQYWVERDFPGARQRFEQVIAKWPNNGDAVLALGLIARRQGRWDQAQNYLNQAIALDPLSSLARGNLAQTLLYMREHAAAQISVDASLNILPDDGFLVGLKAKIQQAVGKLDQADETLKGLHVTPDAGWVIDAIFSQAIYRRQYADAIANFEEALILDKAAGSPGIASSQLNLLLGDLRRLSGDTAGARANYMFVRDELVHQEKRQPGNAPLVSIIALMYCGLGEREQAIGYAERGIKLASAALDEANGPHMELTRARIWARFGERDRAIPALARLLKLPAGRVTPAILRLDPDFDKLRGDPRFEALAQSDEAPK